MIHQFLEKMMEQHDLTTLWKAKFDGTPQWSVNTWITFLAKGGRPKKRFPNWLNSHSSIHFLYFRAIRGHSGGDLVDGTLLDSELSPHDFTEYIHHIGNVSEMFSIIRSGMISGGRSLKKGWAIVFFFTAVNPMDDDQSMEEIRYDLDKPRIAPYKKTHQCSVLVQFKAPSEDRIAVLSNTITRNRSLQHTACDLFVLRKRYFLKTKEEQYHKVFQSPRLPRVELKPNSQSGQQDEPDQEARKSSDPQSVSGRYGETRSDNVD